MFWIKYGLFYHVGEDKNGLNWWRVYAALFEIQQMFSIHMNMISIVEICVNPHFLSQGSNIDINVIIWLKLGSETLLGT